MSESLLQKSFSEKDLQRARNLISGKTENRTQTGVGYEKVFQEHKDGDVWEEGGKVWTMEDGIKVSVSKLQKARELVKIPLTCPVCGKRMDTRYDRKVYPIHGMCFDCVTKFEDSLRRAGMYERYEQEMIQGNVKGFVQDLKDQIKDLEANMDVRTVTGEGEVEDWGTLSKQILDNLDEWVSLFTSKVS